MSGREAFKIKGVVRVHNAILCVWSGLMLAGVIWQIFGVSAPQTGFYNDKGVMCDPGSKLYSKGSLLSYVTYSYYLTPSSSCSRNVRSPSCRRSIMCQ